MKSLLGLAVLLSTLTLGVSQKADAKCNSSTGCFFTVVYDRTQNQTEDTDYYGDYDDEGYYQMEIQEEWYAASGDALKRGSDEFRRGDDAFRNRNFIEAQNRAMSAAREFESARNQAQREGNASNAQQAQNGIAASFDLYNRAVLGSGM